MIDLDLSKCESIPIHMLNENSTAKIHQANVIFARDNASRTVALIYGQHVLDEIAAAGKARNLAGLVVELNMSTADLDQLLALVQSVKGKHDFQYMIEGLR